MVVCVGEPRAVAKKMVTAAVKKVMEEVRHDSLLSRVKQYLNECGRWPHQIEEKFPVVAEVKGLGQMGQMRSKLAQGLQVALGLEASKDKVGNCRGNDGVVTGVNLWR